MTVSDDPLGILDRNTANCLHEGDGSCDDEEPYEELDEKEDRTAVVDGELLADLGYDCVRKTGYDTDHDDQGDTVAYTTVGNTLTEPHHEHRTGHQDDGGNEVEHEVAPTEVVHCHESGRRNLVVHSGEVSRTLDGDDDYSQPPCHLVHLPTAGLALHLEFP